MTHQDHIDRIIKAMSTLKNESELRQTILESLQMTYKRGYDACMKQNNVTWPEDMGR